MKYSFCVKRAVCLSLFVLLLVSCVGCSGSAIRSGDKMIESQFSGIKAYQDSLQNAYEKLDSLKSETPIDSNALWETYTSIIGALHHEYSFKGMLYAELNGNPKKNKKAYKSFMKYEKQQLLDEISALKKEMSNYFSDDEISNYFESDVVSLVFTYYGMGTDWAVEDSNGKIDVDASWNEYLERAVILEQWFGTDELPDTDDTKSDSFDPNYTGESIVPQSYEEGAFYDTSNDVELYIYSENETAYYLTYSDYSRGVAFQDIPYSQTDSTESTLKFYLDGMQSFDESSNYYGFIELRFDPNGSVAYCSDIYSYDDNGNEVFCGTDENEYQLERRDAVG